MFIKVVCVEVFNIIKRMPKGGVLHIHDSAGVSPDFIIDKLMSRDNLYVCFKDGEDGDPKFIFASPRPQDSCYKPIQDYKDKYGSRFKEFFMHKITVIPVLEPDQTIEDVYPDINSIWRRFQGKLTFLLLFCYSLVLLFYQPLSRLKENIAYEE